MARNTPLGLTLKVRVGVRARIMPPGVGVRARIMPPGIGVRARIMPPGFAFQFVFQPVELVQV